MPEMLKTPTDLGALFHALPTGVALMDGAGRIIDANTSFWTAVSRPRGTPATFGDLFEAEAGKFLGNGATVRLGDRHYTLVVRPVADGAICDLHDVTNWVEAQAAARITSNSDPLTGLANREAFLPDVEGAIERGATFAMMMVDLDHFKKVNDTLGHPVGDALLRKVSERLSTAIRKTDRVARLGGDEFAVLQFNSDQPAGAETLAKRIVELIGRPYVIDGHMIDIGASVGVALSGAIGNSADLLKEADIALYRAKHAGRGCYCFFEQSMNAEMQERRALEIDLRRALAFRQFELHYQPQINLKTQRVTGLEALIRWRHPERGLVSPATFIPLAEETGMIIPIGEWVIRQACEHAANWASPVPVAVNVSAKQLASGKLINTVASALAHSGLQPDRLEMEITESVIMANVDNCIATLHALRDLGIRISMDDFGTGYSSLSYLRSFPFHTIKIDQSFIRTMNCEKSDGIIRAITAIGEHLGMTTIAEGVETAAQLDRVTDSGCGSAQGYLFSRPVPADKVDAVLDRLAKTVISVDGAAEEIVAIDSPAAVEPDLFRLVYYSRNTIMGLDEEVQVAVDQILATSQRNNAIVGVTGALMFTDGLFAQVLEGSRTAVETVFERIQLDERHGEVNLLSFGKVDARIFPNWAMAYVGQTERSEARFGHYGAKSGFNFDVANGDQVTSQLRALLLDDERLSMRNAA